MALELNDRQKKELNDSISSVKLKFGLKNVILSKLINRKTTERITPTDLSRINKGKYNLISQSKQVAVLGALKVILEDNESKILLEIEGLKEKSNVSNKLVDETDIFLEKLSSINAISYSIFDHSIEDFQENLWKFNLRKDSEIDILRKEQSGKLFKGSGTIFNRTLKINLTNINNPYETRVYISRLNAVNLFPIHFLSMGFDEKNQPVCGKEILFVQIDANSPQSPHLIKSENEETFHLNEDLSFFLGNKNFSVLNLRPSQPTPDESYIGEYYAYYLRSFSSKLVRNKVKIENSSLGIRFIYETDKKNAYQTLFTYFQHDTLFVLIKDKELDSYFSFHIKEIQSKRNGKLKYLIGSSSCIGKSTRLPVASLIFLDRIDQEDRGNEKLGAIGELSSKENLIKSYLTYKASNPIRVDPVKIEESDNFKFLYELKDEYFQNINKVMNEGIKQPFKKTISTIFEEANIDDEELLNVRYYQYKILSN